MQAVRILAVAALELVLVPWIPTWWLPVWLWGALVTLAVGVAVAARWTPLLGKRRDGTVPVWSLVLFWPWHLVVRLSAWAGRGRGGGPFTEVEPGWWLGAWPHRRDAFEAWPAVVDLTCELPRRGPERAYLCLPTWDRTTPHEDAFDAAVAWILARRAAGEPVLVHCAHGRGRSTHLLVAALVAAGVHPTWREALARVQARRPHVRLSSAAEAALDRWQARRSDKPASSSAAGNPTDAGAL